MPRPQAALAKRQPDFRPANRIAELRKARGWTLEKLADEVGSTSRQQIYKLEHGVNALTTDWMARLGRAFGVPPEEIIRAPEASGASGRSSTRLARIDELDVQAGAGGGLLAEQENVLWQWEMPHEVLPGQEEYLKILRVKGDSMEPTLFSGQRVVVDISDLTPSPPGVFIVWDGIGLVAKRIELLPNSDPLTVRIKSDNSQYDPYERTLDEAYIRGRVVAFWRHI